MPEFYITGLNTADGITTLRVSKDKPKSILLSIHTMWCSEELYARIIFGTKKFRNDLPSIIEFVHEPYFEEALLNEYK